MILLGELRDVIREGKRRVEELGKKWGYLESDDYALELLGAVLDMYRVEIHRNLVFEETEEAEKEIRGHVRDIITTILPVFEEKFSQIEKMRGRIRKVRMREEDVIKKREVDTLFAKYAELYDSFYALVAFRSIQHFALYMEWDFPEKEKIWKYNMNCFHGYWYYANQAILDKKWKRIESQCPTGYGKSYKDIVTIAWILGVNPHADILKVVGNPQLVGDFTQKVVKMMKSDRYYRVFPFYNRFEKNRDEMFSVCQIGGNQQPGRLLVNGSRKGVSLLIINKDTPADGGRFMYRFFDDITKSSDKTSLAAHEKDKARYRDQWNKRKYDDNDDLEFFSGTTYHIEDFLSYVKRMYGGDSAEQSRVNRFTKINPSFFSVFISVPKLDPKTEECTFPHKYSTEEAKKARDADYNTFMAMDQQEPQPLEGCPFSYDEIKTYEKIPHVSGATDESCWAAIDPARTGKNYVSMPIFENIGDYHYLKDCFFMLIDNKKALPFIVDKVQRHHITKLDVENNVDTSFSELLRAEFARRGITYCEISETYSVKNKDARIFDATNSIKEKLVFPARGLYGSGSQMGIFMKYFTSYCYLHKNDFDDAPDSVAQYVNRFVSGFCFMPKVQTINMRRR